LLEKHGIHVAYGIVGFKTHAKASLVIRRENDGLQAYGHIGSGNYHSTTARQYSDVGILTSCKEITDDLIEIFNFLTGRSRHSDYKSLLVAPVTMRNRFIELIDREIEAAKAGRPARIWAKMNQLEDMEIMSRLILASQAGVEIELGIRGFCCLRPGIPGISENIRVVSVIGRFLEHSRIFHFAAGAEDPMDGDWLIGSADWMKRNLDGRVEVIVPVKDPEARRRLNRIMMVNINDRHDSWEMQSDGSYDQLRLSSPQGSMSESFGTFDSLCRDATEANAASAPAVKPSDSGRTDS
jgi:polyphosphate kinase